MKILFILLLATLLDNALHAQFIKATYEQTNYKVIKVVAKQFFAKNFYTASRWASLAKPADDHFLSEVEATGLVVNS